MLPESATVKNQTKVYGPKGFTYNGEFCRITATVRWDDDCGNGRNSFSITADIRSWHYNREVAGGCMHKEIVKAFPELAPFVKWHLMMADGPMYYTENTLYHLGRTGKYTANPPHLTHARNCAVWPKMPFGYVITGTHLSNDYIKQALVRRLPGLMKRFKADVESIGLVY